MTNSHYHDNQDTVKVTEGKYACIECKNENEAKNKELGDVLECDFCGIEYEIAGKQDDKNFILQILEEEK